MLKHLFYAKMSSNEDTLRKRVYAFHAFRNIPTDKADFFTVKYFQEEGFSTFYQISRRKKDLQKS